MKTYVWRIGAGLAAVGIALGAASVTLASAANASAIRPAGVCEGHGNCPY
jgi:hypothetical protein